MLAWNWTGILLALLAGLLLGIALSEWFDTHRTWRAILVSVAMVLVATGGALAEKTS